MRIFLLLTISFISTSLFGQKKIDSSGQVVFVYYENRKTNFIVIPNIDRLHSFKIYRKKQDDSTFIQVAERKKPPLPMRHNITPYGVTWEDKDYHSKEVEYKVVAFDKKDNEICKMNVIWEKDSKKRTVD